MRLDPSGDPLQLLHELHEILPLDGHEPRRNASGVQSPQVLRSHVVRVVTIGSSYKNARCFPGTADTWFQGSLLLACSSYLHQIFGQARYQKNEKTKMHLLPFSTFSERTQ